MTYEQQLIEALQAALRETKRAYDFYQEAYERQGNEILELEAELRSLQELIP